MLKCHNVGPLEFARLGWRGRLKSIERVTVSFNLAFLYVHVAAVSILKCLQPAKVLGKKCD